MRTVGTALPNIGVGAPSLGSSSQAVFDKCAAYLIHQVQVVGGFHKGASFGVGSREVVVGSGLQDDIVMPADALEDSHFSLCAVGAVSNRRIKITALNGGVFLGNGLYLNPGQWDEVLAPETVRAGGAEWKLEPNQSFDVSKKILAACLFIAGLMIAYSGFHTLKDYNGGLAFPGASIGKKIAEIPGQWRESSTLTQITDKLNELGLGDTIFIKALHEGEFVASGSIEDSDRSAWRVFLRWVDENLIGISLATDVVKRNERDKIAVVSDRPVITSIWFDERSAAALTADGSFIRVGEMTSQGWLVAQITRTGVQLERNGETALLTLRGVVR